MSSIRKKQSKRGIYYEISVSRGRQQSRLTTRWYVPDGWSQKTIERELKKVAAEFELKCKSGEIVSKKEQRELDKAAASREAKIPTVRQYGEQVFMPAKKVRLAENSRDSYQRCLDNWIYPRIGDMKITDVTPEDIESLLLSLQAEGKVLSSCKKCHAVLSGLFGRAYKKDVIPRNPMDKVDRPTPRKDEIIKDEVESCTVSEVRYILECLDREPLRWRAYIRLLIDTGCRRGEISALKWSAVDFTNNRIAIVSNDCYTSSAGSYIDTPKSRRVRAIDVGPDVMKLLKDLQSEQADTGPSPYVFPKRGNLDEPMFATTPTKYLATFSKRYGVKLHPHKLRHTYASIGITNGADVASIAENLGHSDKAVTLRMYTHADQESRKRASSIVWESIRENTSSNKEKSTGQVSNE